MMNQEVSIYEIGEDDLLKIAKRIENQNVWNGEYTGKSCWFVLCKEILKDTWFKNITEENIFELYIPKCNNGAKVWLEEEAVNIKSLKDIAVKLKRMDVVYMLATILRNVDITKRKEITTMDISQKEKNKISNLLDLHPSYMRINNWKDVVGEIYEFDGLNRIEKYVAKTRPPWIVLSYIQKNYPYTTLQELENICTEKMKQYEIGQTIKEIKEKNERYVKLYNEIPYNGSPRPHLRTNKCI